MPAALWRERKTTPEVGRDMEVAAATWRSEGRRAGARSVSVREVASGNEASARDAIRGKTGNSHYSIA
jgi:hypothetical protein